MVPNLGSSYSIYRYYNSFGKRWFMSTTFLSCDRINVVFDFTFCFGFCLGAYVDPDKPSSLPKGRRYRPTQFQCKLHLQKFEEVNILFIVMLCRCFNCTNCKISNKNLNPQFITEYFLSNCKSFTT